MIDVDDRSVRRVILPLSQPLAHFVISGSHFSEVIRPPSANAVPM